MPALAGGQRHRQALGLPGGRGRSGRLRGADVRGAVAGQNVDVVAVLRSARVALVLLLQVKDGALEEEHAVSTRKPKQPL